MQMRIGRRALLVLVMYLLLAAAFGFLSALTSYRNGIDVDDGSRLTARGVLSYSWWFAVVYAVMALPALALGLFAGRWARKAQHMGPKEPNL